MDAGMSEPKKSLLERVAEQVAAVSDAEGGVGSLARRILHRLPGGDFVQEQLDSVERRLLLELKHRMDGLEQGPGPAVKVVAVSVQPPPAQPGGKGQTPGNVMRELLAATAEQSREQAESAFFLAILRSLVPDEARILSALSDGSTYPLLHVMSAGRLGLVWQPVVEYVSSVGRSAGIIYPEMGYAYVQHLRALNLVDTGPEDYTQNTKYEMLETEQVVRSALEHIKQAGQRSHITRRVLRMSDLGNRLWAACRISED
jgi:hypothetical protein